MVLFIIIIITYLLFIAIIAPENYLNLQHIKTIYEQEHFI